uniref:Tub domain-containing protein n=1 Tax=Brugia timori TaxID=42155 RepID=A0A0R3QAN4_9BILA
LEYGAPSGGNHSPSLYYRTVNIDSLSMTQLSISPRYNIDILSISTL